MQAAGRRRAASPARPRRAVSIYQGCSADQISIAVPAIVSADLFAVVQEQLAENLRGAQRFYERALALDPNFADAGDRGDTS